MRYVTLIVDNNTNATDELYTYACDFDDIRVGWEVKVPFGIHNRVVDGFVVSVSDEAPAGVKKFKKVLEIGEEQGLSPEAIETAVWMRGRYMCRYVEAVKCFLPGYTPAKRKTKDPFAGIEISEDKAKPATPEQLNALCRIYKSLDEKRHEIFLLHGVTGSGKTEVYLQAMARTLEAGRQGIILVPEISLTPQTVSRFMNRFGRDAVAVIHSKLTPQQRSVEYRKIERGQVKLVIGARSAIFAPFKDIGLIVIDEEHESSYKSDKSPKYDAIEVAAKRAMAHGAAVILGSATPSVQDYYRCGKGIFTLLELPSRYNKVPLPKVSVVDMVDELKHGNRSLFSKELADDMAACLEKRKQVILFLNRRGYAAFVSCRDCGNVIKCPECGISMTYHKDAGSLICHYCGRKTSVPKKCPRCGSGIIGRFGAGTQQLEEKCRELFPQAYVERLDLDTVSAKGNLEKVLKGFADGKTDVLIGTQLIAKGLDFSNVGLVGVISADVSLNIPDFRSAERSFQLMTQAAGRAGRGEEQGKVVIQTCQPDHPAILSAAKQDYLKFYEGELAVRKAVGYPPFSDIFQIVISDEDCEKAERSADRCARRLRSTVPEGIAVLGPAISPINSIGGKYRYQLLVKSPAGMRREISRIILQLRRSFTEDKTSAELMTTDINPYSFL
ncbi:MAG: primosomal protein N' [Clostridia bacterium]|nr:primosomal protein N' [Clostridia bacterium]